MCCSTPTARCCRRRSTRRLIDTGLDELRVSLDAADAKTFLAVRGKNFFERIVRNVRGFTELQRASRRHIAPRVSLWLTGLKETVEQLPAFVRLAAVDGRAGGVSAATGVRRDGLRPGAFAVVVVRDAARRGDGARSRPRRSWRANSASHWMPPAQPSRASVCKRQDAAQPWSTCRRPWSLMYFTAHGRALPCCIAPFSARGYDSYTLGDATQQTLRGDLEWPGIPGFPHGTAQRHAAAAVRRVRAAVESVGHR